MDGAFSFCSSHVCLPRTDDVVRARSMSQASGAARLCISPARLAHRVLFLVWHSRLRLWFVGFSFLFLIPCFSAVLDFGEELAQILNVCVSPEVDSHTSARHRLGLRNPASLDVFG